MFCTNWSSSISRFLMATLKHKTFFTWNLMVLCKSLIFSSKLSPWVSKEGNLPALLRPGPKSLGICLIRDSEAKNASNFLVSFLTRFLDLFIKVVSVSKQRREFASFVKTRSQKPGNLLDKRLGSQKCIVFLGELLNKFLLLVQLFQVVGAHVGNTRFLSLITMLLITKDADGEFWPWDMAQSTGKKLLQPKNLTTLKLLIKATTWSRVDKKNQLRILFSRI